MALSFFVYLKVERLKVINEFYFEKLYECVYRQRINNWIEQRINIEKNFVESFPFPMFRGSSKEVLKRNSTLLSRTESLLNFSLSIENTPQSQWKYQGNCKEIWMSIVSRKREKLVIFILYSVAMACTEHLRVHFMSIRLDRIFPSAAQ